VTPLTVWILRARSLLWTAPGRLDVAREWSGTRPGGKKFAEDTRAGDPRHREWQQPSFESV